MRAVLLLCLVLAVLATRGTAYGYADGDDADYLAELTTSDLRKMLQERGVEAPAAATAADLRRLVSTTEDRDEAVAAPTKAATKGAASSTRGKGAAVAVTVLYCMS